MRSFGICTLACACAFALAGCGGGGGGGNKSGSGGNQGGGSTTTPAASLTVTVTSPAINASITQGDAYSASVSGTWSASNLGNGAVYLQVTDSANTFILPAIQQAPGNKAFSYALPIATALASGEHSGSIAVRACKDVACSQPYSGATGSISYRIVVGNPADWGTEQGNAAHDGYVPISVDSSKFVKAWEWNSSNNESSSQNYLAGPVTGDGAVYLRHRLTTAQGGVGKIQDGIMALDESDGGVRWTYSAPSGPDGMTIYLGNPAYASGRLYFGEWLGVMASGFTALDSRSGSEVLSSSSILMSDPRMVPTPLDGNLYFSEQDSGFRVCVALDGADGQALWHSAPLSEPDVAMSTLPLAVASDAEHVYFQGQAGLHIIDKSTSNEVAVLPSSRAADDNFDPPLVTLGGRGNALTYVYKFSPVSFQYEWFIQSYNIASRTLEWVTPLYFNAVPAVANSVIYSARSENNKVSLHALDEVTGQTLWVWNAPEADARFLVGNIVATKSHVFLSAGGPTMGTATTWAVDVRTHQAAWSYPAGGAKAISANRVLYITQSSGDVISNAAKLVAIKLR